MTHEEIGKWIGILVIVGILAGAGAVFNGQPKDRTIKTFVQYFFGGVFVCGLVVVIWRGVDTFLP